MLKISAVIITLNEEKKIAACLDSLKGVVDEIVVLDSNSTDRTKVISLQNGATFYSHPFKNYVDQKNVALDHASYDYVLSLDADEVLSTELKKSILVLKKNWTHDGYSFNRLTNYCGFRVKHCGWYPDVKLRLVDRRKARWTGESLHEKLEMSQGESVKHLKGNLLHFSYDSIESHLLQINHFTNMNAASLFERGKKATAFKVLYSFPVRFCRDYFLKLGILDGYYGFLICSFSAWASLLKYAKLRQLWKETKTASS
ncbi:MAG: glycosyltransferase family 2 protein [Bacteroidota bacterium]